MAFDHEQRTIARSACVAIGLTSIMLALTGFIVFFEANHLPQRLTLFALALAALAIALFRDIARLANHRFTEPLDRDAAAASTMTATADMLSAILRNTHEQATLAVLVYAMAAILLPGHWTDAIAGCAAFFLMGRLFFAAGYAKGAGSRAFGFGLTFYPTVALAILTVVTVAF
jgi:MAPEG family